jgi:hypothetical protein
VLCERWAVARPSLRGAADIAECARASCGPWQSAESSLGNRRGLASRGADAVGAAWPSWATWGLVGAGALAATGFILWQAGAFERDEPTTEFVFTGPGAPVLRF